MMDFYSPYRWWGEHVTKPLWYASARHIQEHPSVGTAVGATGLGILGGIPHIYVGSRGYRTALQIAHVGQRARDYSNAISLGVMSSRHMPRASTLKFVSKAVPILGIASLAYDLYDIIFNRSFWGIDFD